MENSNKIKQPVKLYGVEVVYLLLVGIVFTFFGWFGENMVKLVSDGFIDSRFHLLPFIGAYALITFAFQLAFRDPDDICFFSHYLFKKKTLANKIWSNIITFFVIALFVFLGELALGNILELAFGVKLWDYTGGLCNVTQYTCLESTFGYALGAYILFKFIFHPLINFFRKHLSTKTAFIIVITLGSLILLDELRLYGYMIFGNEAPNYWKLIIFKK